MMGSICYIINNPENWYVFDSGKRLKPQFGGEALLEVRFGSFDDYPDGESEMKMYMRESVYQKLMRKEYKVSPNSKWKHRLILINGAGEEVPALDSNIY